MTLLNSLSKSTARIFGFFGKILDFSSKLSFSLGNIGNCLASGSSEGLCLKGQVLIIQRKGEWGEFQKRGSFGGENYCGGLEAVMKAQVLQKGRKIMMPGGARDKEAKQGGTEPFYFSLIISLPSLILKSYFAKRQFQTTDLREASRISVKITIPFSSGNLLWHRRPIQF